MHDTRSLQDPKVLRNAVRRYETFWLPLVAEYGIQNDFQLAPPLDIAWIWHCHLLSPRFYIPDCKSITGESLFQCSYMACILRIPATHKAQITAVFYILLDIFITRPSFKILRGVFTKGKKTPLRFLYVVY